MRRRLQRLVQIAADRRDQLVQMAAEEVIGLGDHVQVDLDPALLRQLLYQLAHRIAGTTLSPCAMRPEDGQGAKN